MKRFITLLSAALLLCTLTVSSVSALTCSMTKPGAELGELVVSKTADQNDIAESYGSIPNLQRGGTKFCPKNDGWVRYEFNADKAGTYTFVIDYIARTGNERAIDIAIDDLNKRTFLDLTESAEHQYAVENVTLSAGTHSLYFIQPTGFDDSSLKSADIYGLEIYYAGEAAADAPAASKTADASSVSIALLLTAGAAFMALKKAR